MGHDEGLWKLVLGRQSQAGWQGPQFPNASTNHWNSSETVIDCGNAGCLFRLDHDPSEQHDLANRERNRVARMLAEIRDANSSTFSPHRGWPDMEGACKVAKERYKGFWGPFLGLDVELTSKGALLV